MRVRGRWLFQLCETARTALLIQHLLLLKALHLEPRFIPLIIDAGEYQDVQDQQAAADGDCHAQGRRIRRVTAHVRDLLIDPATRGKREIKGITRRDPILNSLQGHSSLSLSLSLSVFL